MLDKMELDSFLWNRYIYTGYNPVSNPIFPEYRRHSKRVKSFEIVPSYILERPESFARAGFFCLNPDFDIACFCCGGSLSEWNSNRNPWSLHVALDKTCRFLRLMQGDAFIRSMLLINQVLRRYEQEFP